MPFNITNGLIFIVIFLFMILLPFLELPLVSFYIFYIIVFNYNKKNDYTGTPSFLLTDCPF